MAVYSKTTYTVGGQYTHGGDIETHYDPMPEGLNRVWEIEPYDPNDTTPWVRDADGIWTLEGRADESQALEWEDLLDGFSPVTDDEADAGIGISALTARYEHDAYIALLYGTV